MYRREIKGVEENGKTKKEEGDEVRGRKEEKERERVRERESSGINGDRRER